MENLDDKIDKTLGALEGIERAEPNPFFYARLKARMENAQEALPPRIRWVMKPSFVFSGLALIIILNVVSVINYSKNSQQPEKQSIEGFASEYGLSE
jgi:hypothetical protein